MTAMRWSDKDAYFGPFTWSWSEYRPLAVMLSSWGGGQDDDNPCHLRVSWLWGTLIIVLPPIIRPHRQKVFPQWDKATVDRLGRDFYWDIDERSYGFSVNDGHLSVHYGRAGGSMMDSSIEQRWSCFLPWTQWRHIRRSFYDLEGKHFWSELESETDNYRRANKLGRSDLWRERFDIVRKWEELCPKATFRIRDCDDQEIDATTHIEEREWHFGTGWFKWLSLFRRAKIRRTLDISFSGETGPEKGSWKGGTVGTSIDMLPSELHEAAFRRYCGQEHRSKYSKYSVKFIGSA